MVMFQRGDLILRFITATFIVSISLVILLLISSTLFLHHKTVVEIFSSYGRGIILLLLAVFLIQFLAKVFEYFAVGRRDYVRRQAVVLSILLFIIAFLFIFSFFLKTDNYNDILLGYVIPMFFISVAGFFTLVDLIRLFYVYPSLLFVIVSIFLIIVVAVLLHLPIASATGEPIPLIDTFFVATSAISCTGLSTVSVGRDLSLFGQIVLMLAIQIGGLLIIFISTVGILFGLLSGDAILKLRMASFFEMGSVAQTQSLILKFFALSFTSQIVVAILIYPYFFEVERDEGRAIFYSLFHVVSALNNAGFSTYDDSLVRFSNYPYFLMFLSYLILLGNTGVIVVIEVFDYVVSRIKRFINLIMHRKDLSVKRLSVFSKIVLITHFTLIVFGTFSFFVFEGDHFLRQVKYPLIDALFNSISFRTAGFASFDFTQAKDSTYLFFSLLMFIGGGSISVAGGIKMNTVALFFIATIVLLKSYPYLYVMKREIDFYSLIKASAVVVGGVVVLMVGIFILYELVKEERFSKVIFEITSAFGTVGTSSGIVSKDLSVPAKLVFIFMMFVGKIGLITFLSILARKQQRNIGIFPKERIIVG